MNVSGLHVIIWQTPTLLADSIAKTSACKSKLNIIRHRNSSRCHPRSLLQVIHCAMQRFASRVTPVCVSKPGCHSQANLKTPMSMSSQPMLAEQKLPRSLYLSPPSSPPVHICPSARMLAHSSSTSANTKWHPAASHAAVTSRSLQLKEVMQQGHRLGEPADAWPLSEAHDSDGLFAPDGLGVEAARGSELALSDGCRAGPEVLWGRTGGEVARQALNHSRQLLRLVGALPWCLTCMSRSRCFKSQQIAFSYCLSILYGTKKF